MREASTLAHRGDPETSHQAAESLPDLSELRAAVLALISERPSTVTELKARYLEVGPARGYPQLNDMHNIARRVSDLHGKKLIRESGQTRPTRLGKQSTVWEVTNA